MKNQRVSKEDRKKNARTWYHGPFQNNPRAVLIVDRHDSTTNPNVNRVQLITAISQGTPSVIAESATEGVYGAVLELFEFLGCDISRDFVGVSLLDANFNSRVKKKFGFRFTYYDGLTIIVEH